MEKIVINGVVFFDSEEWPANEKGYFPFAIMCFLAKLNQFKLDYRDLEKNAEKERTEIQENCGCPEDQRVVFSDENLVFKMRCVLCKKVYTRTGSPAQIK